MWGRDTLAPRSLMRGSVLIRGVRGCLLPWSGGFRGEKNARKEGQRNPSGLFPPSPLAVEAAACCHPFRGFGHGVPTHAWGQRLQQERADSVSSWCVVSFEGYPCASLCSLGLGLSSAHVARLFFSLDASASSVPTFPGLRRE